jgi:hypothetical protein
VTHAAQSLDVQPPGARRFGLGRIKGSASLFAAAAVVTLAAALGTGATALLYQRFASGVVHAESTVATPRAPFAPAAPGFSAAAPGHRRLPANAAQTILVGSYPVADPTSVEGVRALTDWLEAMGFKVFYADADLGSLGHWHRVLAGAYTDLETARRDAARLQSVAPATGVRLVSAEFATGTMEQ